LKAEVLVPVIVPGRVLGLVPGSVPDWFLVPEIAILWTEALLNDFVYQCLTAIETFNGLVAFLRCNIVN